jgi:hypothetical protein
VAYWTASLRSVTCAGAAKFVTDARSWRWSGEDAARRTDHLQDAQRLYVNPGIVHAVLAKRMRGVTGQRARHQRPRPLRVHRHPNKKAIRPTVWSLHHLEAQGAVIDYDHYIQPAPGAAQAAVHSRGQIPGASCPRRVRREVMRLMFPARLGRPQAPRRWHARHDVYFGAVGI